MAFPVPTGCVRLARYCGKMYSHHLYGTVDCSQHFLTLEALRFLLCDLLPKTLIQLFFVR